MKNTLKNTLTRYCWIAILAILAISQASFMPASADGISTNLSNNNEPLPENRGISAAELEIARKLSVYDSLVLEKQGLSFEAFELAVRGMQKLIETGKVKKQSIISIVDFSQPSASERLYIIDLNSYKLLYKTYVAHGRNSGKERAQAFSNRNSSNQSSLGFYVTAETYKGAHGFSLRLDGLEKGINDNARKRAIVMHAADYVNPRLIKSQGYIGRSLGCPAILPSLHKSIINLIKDGSAMFVYHPSQQYVKTSGLLN